MALAIAALAAAAAVQAPAAPAPCTTLCGAEALAPFFAKLAAPRGAGQGPLHILQIGDSHTAGDMISNGLRSRLQARYGHGGRGALAPGRPYRGYITWGVTAFQSPGWSVNSIFGPSYSSQGGRPLGISGYTQTARSAGQSLGFTADSDADRFDRIVVCALKEPGAGAVTLRFGTAEQQWHLNSDTSSAQCRAFESDLKVNRASLTTQDNRPVSITSFGVFDRRAGIALSNFGVSGSQLVHQARQNDDVARTELAAYRPDLILLAFGTNEGFSQSLTAEKYEADLRLQVARIRRLAGAEVPILLLGAPDAATRNPAFAGGGAGSCGGGWVTPAFIAEVRRRQRSLARELGLAFWDWHQAMGGQCSALRWQARGHMGGDRIHFTRAGGDEVGAMLFRDLTAAAAATRTQP